MRVHNATQILRNAMRAHLDTTTTGAMRSKSGTGLPHSKTLRDDLDCAKFRQVLECGSPVLLSPVHSTMVVVPKGPRVGCWAAEI